MLTDIAKAALLRARLYLWRRDQFENRSLRAFFEREYDIQVGLYSYGCFDRWRLPGPLRIGRYCSFADTVRYANGNHPLDALTTHPALYEAEFGIAEADPNWPALTVEDDVWVGHNVVILPGCRFIGRGAVIGAGSIVTRDVDRYTVVAGVPARKIRDRFTPDLAAAVEASGWWRLDLSEVRIMAKTTPDVLFHPTTETLAAWTSARS
jgi:acetyltransferase-like isoleucine patch superfamily enzyme